MVGSPLSHPELSQAILEPLMDIRTILKAVLLVSVLAIMLLIGLILEGLAVAGGQGMDVRTVQPPGP